MNGTRGDRGWDGVSDFRLQYERAILRSSELEPLSRLLALAFKSRSDEDGYCFPKIETLAADTGMSDRTVRKHLAALRAVGCVRRKRGRGASDYWLAIPPCLSDRHEVPISSARGAALDRHEMPTEEVHLKKTREDVTEEVELAHASGASGPEQSHLKRESNPANVRRRIARSLAEAKR